MTPMSSDQYKNQDRGTAAAYEAYFAGMDASVQQKIALTTAHFPTSGKVADMGCGSGRGTYDLACLYQDLELVGVDVNPVSVERASELYSRPNARFVVGDISEMVFPPESLDGILNSSVLHHVTSFNGYDLNRVRKTLDNQVAQLKAGGVLIIRDFVIPDGPDRVYLDLPATDGADHGPVKELSTSALFRQFAAGFRGSVNTNGPVTYSLIGPVGNDRIRYQLGLRAAAEFVLRKDYRADWDTELIEEYTYMSQSDFESEFRMRGLRIVASMPLWNPWIVRNRFEGRFELFSLGSEILPFPPTNYLIVGEKVTAGSGVALVEVSNSAISRPGFLGMKHYRHKATGYVYELAERPNFTIDLVPWFDCEGQIFVIAKKDFPRPIINAAASQPALESSALSGYITEPLSAIVEPGEASDDAVSRVLLDRARLAADEIIEIGPEFKYFTSPGGVDELVTSRLVQLTPVHRPHVDVSNYTGFNCAGFVRELDAIQTLRACQVGGMFDARLEINIYRLLLRLGVSAGPWIGAQIEPVMQRETGLAPSTAGSALTPERGVAFEQSRGSSEVRFLSLIEGIFAEVDVHGHGLAEVRFEYIVPRALSKNTVVGIPVARTPGGTYTAVEHRDLPAVQRFTGSSAIATAPAWRLPASVKHRSQIPEFLSLGMSRDFGVRIRGCWDLGGPYFPTVGITPELVRPYAVEIDLSSFSGSPLIIVRVDEMLASLDLIQDAHLLIALLRLSHALGIGGGVGTEQ
jgi:ubiquinone/menaquinone biosynthesis C-methylase UbiE